MKKYILTTILFISLLSNLNSEIVEEILIKGNDRISEETIKVYGDIEIKKIIQKKI